MKQNPWAVVAGESFVVEEEKKKGPWRPKKKPHAEKRAQSHASQGKRWRHAATTHKERENEGQRKCDYFSSREEYSILNGRKGGGA